MIRRLLCRAACLALVLPLFAAALRTVDEDAAPKFSEREIRQILTHSPLPPPPPDPTNRYADDPAAARLGQALFFDVRISSDGRHACASCHIPARSFADATRLSDGAGGAGVRHTPSLWNAAYNRWFFWDGRADSLWAQAVQPIENPLEQDFSRVDLARLFATDRELREAYERIFGPLPDVSDERRFPPGARPGSGRGDDERASAWRGMAEQDREAVTAVLVNAAKALAAYQRRLVSRNAPFDRFVEGLREGDDEKLAALSPAARRGLRLFLGRGNCRSCHNGPNFTDGEFHNTAVPPLDGPVPRDAARYEGAALVLRDPFNALGPYSDDRTGTAARMLEFLANPPENWGLFKTPTLRNVALTAPYMHQGQFETLEQVIEFYATREGAVSMGHHRQETVLQPFELSPRDRDDLIAFLHSLTDTEIDPALLRPPPSPLLESSAGRLDRP